MKSSQSNFDLRSPSSYLARSYLIATVSMFFAKIQVLMKQFDFFNYTKKKKIAQKNRACVVARLKKDQIDAEHDYNLPKLVEKSFNYVPLMI